MVVADALERGEQRGARARLVRAERGSPDSVKQTRKALGIGDMCPAAPGSNPGRRLAAIGISEGRQQEERLQAVIDSSPLALVEFGLDTRIRLWNPAAERIFGWTREEIVGRGGLPMAPPEKRAESVTCSCASARASG